MSSTGLVGQVLLGRYRVLRRLALGGMGAVYLARTEGARGFSKPVVIKRILPIWGGDEEIVSLFAREARILSQLQDPGIVSVIDFGQIADGTLVMVLDYVHGYHLAHWLAYLRASAGQMPVDMALHIVLRVLSALQYAHSFVKSDGKPLEVIHRDVSPTNILLDMSGNVKLVDFGIARAEGDNDEYKTAAPQLRGKFGYLAPELFTGAPPTPQSDVYASGVVLYELLTGDNPFRGREVTDSYHRALNVEAPPLHELRADVTPALSEVVATSLAKQPAARYGSAGIFADALRPHRPDPDEVCQARLRLAVMTAFVGPLADALGIEPLSASDEAWRDAAEGVETSLATALAHPTPAPSTENSGTVPLVSGRADAGKDDPTERTSRAQLQDDGSEVPTVRRNHLEGSIPPVRALYVRMVIVAGAALLFGSAVVAGIVRYFEDKNDRVIVIEREREDKADVPSVEQSGPSAPSAAIPIEAAPLTAEAPAANSGKATKPNPTKSIPAAPQGPEPAMLTSAFAREQGRIQHCFSEHAASNASPGDITVAFQVSASGDVEKAELVPDLPGSALGACLVGVAKATHFPRLTRPVAFRIPIQARVAQP
jgi:serine/threonine protein kinase